AAQGGGVSPTATTSGLLGAGGSMAGGLLGSQFEMFRQMLETSIRKVTLKVTWDALGEETSFVTEAYFTEPAAINKVLGGAAGGGEAPAADGGGGDGDRAGGDGGGASPARSFNRRRGESGQTGGGR